MTKYLLDANIFIDSHNRQYGMDFCPAFWDWLVAKNQDGRVFSIDRICGELEQQADVLCDWAKGRGKEFFLPFDQVATDQIAEVTTWVAQQTRFKPAAVAAFFTGQDLYLIAYAIAHEHVIITHETSAPASQTKVKIPDVCAAFDVRCLTLWELLRAEGARFVMHA